MDCTDNAVSGTMQKAGKMNKHKKIQWHAPIYRINASVEQTAIRQKAEGE